MADKKKTIIELLKNLESTLQEIKETEVNDEDSLKRILKEFCMKFNYDVQDRSELLYLTNSINEILGAIVLKYSKIVEDTKSSAVDEKPVPTGGPMPMATAEPISEGLRLSGGKKRKTKNKKTKKIKKNRTKNLKKKKSKKYRKVNTKKH